MSQCSSGRNKNPPALAVGSVKKYSKDDGKMDVFIRSNENMSHMDRMAAEVMKCIGKIPMEIEEGGEVNMCKAIDDMMEKREQKGKNRWKKQRNLIRVRIMQWRRRTRRNDRIWQFPSGGIVYLLCAGTRVFDDQPASASGACIIVWILSVLCFFKRGEEDTLPGFFLCWYVCDHGGN